MDTQNKFMKVSSIPILLLDSHEKCVATKTKKLIDFGCIKIH